MRLTVLSVGFSLAPVTRDPVGGSEQILARLDRALIARGHRSIVVAPEGSEVAGELRPVPAVAGPIGAAEVRAAQAAMRAQVAAAIERERPDVVHMHGLDFDACLPASGPPVLVSLHLPLGWYGAGALVPERGDVFLHPVSRAQASTCPDGITLCEPIENGVEIGAPAERKRGFLLALGRICPEKGFDDALDAAHHARMPLVMAGAVFPYPDHEAHFRAEIVPRLSWRRRWIGTVVGARKQWLMAAARCVLIPSRAPETSSLVAMEALAAGTPVIAYPSGALAEIVEHGRTGFLVDGVAAMAEAILHVSEIDPQQCRRRAAERFSAGRMIENYLGRYAELASR